MFSADFWEILILGLASFRLTRLLVFDKISGFLRRPFFDELSEVNEAGETEVYYVPKSSGIKKFFGELLSCYWCTGIWASTFLVLLYWLFPVAGDVVIVILAVAAVGSILELFVSNMLGN
ncbi:DUF1360 domain-containing protein [Neobacillus sp. SM06]|uniref:DUF1360 domain-containing protein n=1 Tax=Neobacillus sp. SM06 TaxID=3422492 RepID=UPI003D2A4905